MAAHIVIKAYATGRPSTLSYTVRNASFRPPRGTTWDELDQALAPGGVLRQVQISDDLNGSYYLANLGYVAFKGHLEATDQLGSDLRKLLKSARKTRHVYAVQSSSNVAPASEDRAASGEITPAISILVANCCSPASSSSAAASSLAASSRSKTAAEMSAWDVICAKARLETSPGQMLNISGLQQVGELSYQNVTNRTFNLPWCDLLFIYDSCLKHLRFKCNGVENLTIHQVSWKTFAGRWRKNRDLRSKILNAICSQKYGQVSRY